MRVKVKRVVQSLEFAAKWIKNLPGRSSCSKTRDRAEDIVTGCLDLIEYSPTTDVNGWIAAKPRRKRLNDPAKAVWTRDGRRAALELITLTISEVEACRSFRPDVEVGALPIRTPVTPSAAQLASLDRGRRGNNQKRHKRSTRCSPRHA